MIRIKFKLLIAALIFASFGQVSVAGDKIEVTKDFTLFTSKNFAGYSKPFWTTIGESFHSNLFTSAQYKDEWTFALDISMQQFFIPDAQKTFDAELPEDYGNTSLVENTDVRDRTNNVSGYSSQPTIYGGSSYAVYAAPQSQAMQSQYNKSVAFAEGNNLDYMPGIPNIQFIFGFPTQTQLRLRFFIVPDVQANNLLYYGIMLNQRIDEYMNLFQNDTTMALALHLSYHSMTLGSGLDMSSFAGGAHFSKYLSDGFTGYLGLQYESLGGTFEAIRTDFDPNDVANSPYKEVRSGEDIIFDLESFTTIRALAGISFRKGFLEIHLDGGYASQPMIDFGFTFWFGIWGEEKQLKDEEIEDFEGIEGVEKVKTIDEESK